MAATAPATQQVERQRWRLLLQVSDLLERPMIALSLLWLVLLVLEFTTGIGPLLRNLGYAIWAVFIVHFLLEFFIAPRKTVYLRRNWLTALSLVLPAFRLLRVFRAFRVLRGLRAARAVRSVGLLRLLTSVNRSMRALGNALGRRGVGYVAALTVIVVFAAAAGMLFFENSAALRDAGYPDAAARGAGLDTYSEAFWWTAMMITTVGSEYWPKTPEGRILCWFLALYAFMFFGYLTATLASFFVQREAAESRARESEVEQLRRELAALRAQLAALRPRLPAADAAD